MVERQRDHPHAMTCTSTHDTKRGEDVRARITVLAEIPGQWQVALAHLLDLAPVPDLGFGSLLWQAVLGAWPEDDDPDLRARLHGYAEKAMREAGDHTFWTAPDEDYEGAVHAAVDAAFDHPQVGEVIEALLGATADPGRSNALAAKLIALTMPGVPDVYQGSELWERSLVDPDNRRPVDFDHRAELLSGRSLDPAAAKQRLVTNALVALRDRSQLFTTYTPLRATGEAADHVLAFDRGGALTIATRLPVGLVARGGWGSTALELPEGTWTNALTGITSSGLVPLSTLLAHYPVALLTREDL